MTHNLSKFAKYFFLSTILIAFLLGGYFIYQKYNQYLPSTDVVHSPPLEQVSIDQIRSQTPINKVHVYKAQRRLELLHDEQIIKTYHMRLGFAPVGHKVQEGDGKTPEGRYEIDWRNPQSAFYKSLHISYPNAQDKAKAAALGVSPGGDIMIHGSASTPQIKKLPSLMDYFPRNDWTWGCIAVKNTDMDEIWLLVSNGTPIEIFP